MDPFQNMQDWRKNMDRFFGENFWGEFEGIMKPPIPHINLYKSDNEILCYVSIPGLDDIDKVDVYVDYSILEIKGVISLQPHHHQMVHEEILQGSFERKIDLPYPVRGDKIHASYKNGLLIIQLHRLIHEETNKNRIKIHAMED